MRKKGPNESSPEEKIENKKFIFLEDKWKSLLSQTNMLSTYTIIASFSYNSNNIICVSLTEFTDYISYQKSQFIFQQIIPSFIRRCYLLVQKLEEKLI